MEIKWHGQSCFEIKGKSVVVATDPYSEEIGLKLPKIKADVVTVSHGHYDHKNVEALQKENAEIFVAENPGGYEVKGVLLEGIASFHDDKGGTLRGPNTIFDIKMDGVTICHLGDLGHELSEDLVESVDGVDILLVPVGGTYTLDAKLAAKVVGDIEPRIVIPMHCQIDGLKIDLDSVDKFIKELGVEAEKMDSFKFDKKDLPVEGMRLVILACS
ncbi:MBL fold metallo-hydrolase [Candidatus Microgenomates bacterium]|nr:MBL fold metallo-hydrolase [Candidatus Microgenomates bacterium]